MAPDRILVASAQHQQYYHRLLYEPLGSAVATVPFSFPASAEEAAEHLRGIDVFHLHSPEDLPLGPSLACHRSFAAALERSATRLVWTQHNFEPHDKSLRARYRPIYDEWARHADTVVHHSRWGMAECRKRFPYRADARHWIVPHGHFGPLMPELQDLDPRQCRAELGLHPDRVCLGVIGHPRPEKQVTLAMQAFVAAQRSDLQLLVLSLADDDAVPSHPQVTAIPHRPLPRPQYNRRLRAIDVAVMPFGPGMLTTGSVADVIGLGIPAIISDWPYLGEVLGDAAIPYGSGVDALARCIAELSGDRLLTAREAMIDKQREYAYEAVAAVALAMLRETVAS